MPTWTLKADRRRADPDEITRALSSLEQSVRDLSVEFVDREVFDAADDAGDFRDFAPLARLTHEQLEGLEIVAEHLVDEFGWWIDFGQPDEQE